MNAFLTSAGLLFVAALLIANPAAFLRLTDGFVTGIERFHLHLLGNRNPHQVFALAPTNLASVRLAGAVLAFVGLLIAGLS